MDGQGGRDTVSLRPVRLYRISLRRIDALSSSPSVRPKAESACHAREGRKAAQDTKTVVRQGRRYCTITTYYKIIIAAVFATTIVVILSRG